MKAKPIFVLWSIFYLTFGLFLLLIPNEFMTVFGCPLDKHGALTSRAFGSALIGLFFMFYLLKNLNPNNAAFRPVVLFSLIFNILAAPVMALGTLDGALNQLGWIPVSVNLTIAITAFLLLKNNKVINHDSAF